MTMPVPELEAILEQAVVLNARQQFLNRERNQWKMAPPYYESAQAALADVARRQTGVERVQEIDAEIADIEDAQKRHHRFLREANLIGVWIRYGDHGVKALQGHIMVLPWEQIVPPPTPQPESQPEPQPERENLAELACAALRTDPESNRSVTLALLAIVDALNSPLRGL